jgi:hypothetical protein
MGDGDSHRNGDGGNVNERKGIRSHVPYSHMYKKRGEEKNKTWDIP